MITVLVHSALGDDQPEVVKASGVYIGTFLAGFGEKICIGVSQYPAEWEFAMLISAGEKYTSVMKVVKDGDNIEVTLNPKYPVGG